MNIIIIGAGAAGLMAARMLTDQHDVLVLEARDRIGGRIHTVQNKYSLPFEEGAEFVHGEQPLTKSLLAEAKKHRKLVDGSRFQVWDGEMMEQDFFDDDWKRLTDDLNSLEHDVTIATFLEKKFGDDRYRSLRKRIRGFVEGYDAADMERVSALALAAEWSESDDEHQYRVEGGYSALTDFLAERVTASGGKIVLSSAVTTVRWKKGNVDVINQDGQTFKAEKVIVTVPLGVLQRDTIRFSPTLPAHATAFRSMGFGGVIKFFAEFGSAFWENAGARKFRDLAFVFSDAEIPTWWTQRPVTTTFLTGWLGGPSTYHLPRSQELIFEKALRSLEYIFERQAQDIRKDILQWHCVNWVDDPLSCGAYAYPTTETKAALKVVTTPVDDTVYFAGEAIYEGSAIGTVEAALESGCQVATRVGHP